MAGLVQRLQNQFPIACYEAPLNGLGRGIVGAIYAYYTKMSLEKVATAYVVWGVAESIFSNLAAVLTEDKQKQTMLKSGVNMISCMVGIAKLTQMKLMGHVCAIAVAIAYFTWETGILKQIGAFKN
jgi:hypothetical protein